MSPELINVLMYVGIILAVVLVAFGGVFLKKKYNLVKTDADSTKNILGIVDYLVNISNISIKGKISEVIKYTIEAIDFVETSGGWTTIDEEVNAIVDKAKEICTEKSITIDENFDNVVKAIIKQVLKVTNVSETVVVPEVKTENVVPTVISTPVIPLIENKVSDTEATITPVETVNSDK